MARPTDYTPEIAESICQHIAGGNSLRSFCVSDNTPHVATVCRWIVKHDEFREQYMHAREAAGFAHADNIVDVVELVRTGEVDANSARAMMDGLKWAAERMASKYHSPNQKHEHTSPDGSMTPDRTLAERLTNGSKK